ncbi:MAG: Ig-like domain-containing protein [Dysgonamonadaceae bacterium]|nr:Ig-like domain-containing protein [Dysgonamonadaceae bacterium]
MSEEIRTLPMAYTQAAYSASILVTGINITSSALSFTSIGTVQNVGASVVPSNATNKTILYSSDNNAVATVDSSGQVTSVANGTCTITSKTQDGNFTKLCFVTVNAVAQEYIFETAITQMNFDASGTTQNVVITSSYQGTFSPFVIQNSPEWMTAMQVDYNDETLMTRKITLSPNTTGLPRTGTLQLRQTASGKLLSITLNQSV